MTRRVLASFLAFAALAVLCLEICLGYVYTRTERDRVVGQVAHSAEVLAAVADEPIGTGRLDDLRVLAVSGARQLDGRVVIVDRRGTLMATSHPLDPREADPSTLPEIQAALVREADVGVRTTRVAGVESLSVTVPARPGPEVRGAVRVTVPAASVATRVHRLWRFQAAAGLAVLVAAAVAAFALARWVSRPVRALEHLAAHLADGTLTAPVSTVDGPPEVRRIAATLDRAAARLHDLVESQQAFARHAAQRLETPLATLRLRLESLEPDVAPHARADLEAALTETDGLVRTVEALMAMARLEETATEPEPFDLDVAVHGRARMWMPLAEQHGVRLTVTGSPVGWVCVVPGALEQIIDNLLSNALRVAPPGSTVALDRRPGASAPEHAHDGDARPMVELHVIDQGPGMGERDRQRAFERFWRAPSAPHDGTGLGLPLVRQLVEASGGQVALLPAPGHGVDAVVLLPSCPPAPPAGAAGGPPPTPW